VIDFEAVRRLQNFQVHVNAPLTSIATVAFIANHVAVVIGAPVIVAEALIIHVIKEHPGSILKQKFLHGI
jgi:hypothetical protein